MASPNTVVIEGNLGRDPEQHGNGPVKFSVCWNQSKKNKATDEWERVPHWFDVISWDRETVAQAGLTKGQRVVVAGRIHQEKWSDKETGQERSKVVIVADTVSRSLDKPAANDGPDW